jgi:hypothetical protein
VAVSAAPVSAQTLWIGAGVQLDLQRFAEDVVPNRLDGATTGWRIGAAGLVRRHVVVAAEWSDAGTIEDLRALTLDVNGRTATIASTFTHHTRSLSALAGYGHELTTRVRIAYLVGIAVTDVQRAFTSNAAAAVLVSPSTSATAMPVEDRFSAVTGGVDVHVRVTRQVHVLAGVRAQPLRLDPDLRGWSLRCFIGAAWAP